MFSVFRDDGCYHVGGSRVLWEYRGSGCLVRNGFIRSLQELLWRMSLGREAGHVSGKEGMYVPRPSHENACTFSQL